MRSTHRTNQGSHLVIARCPPPTELLSYALQLAGDREPRDTAHHVSQCASCADTVTGLREVASVLQSTGRHATATDSCLDEMMVAGVADQSVALAKRPDLVAHLAACARCREQAASVSLVLGDTAVATEIRR